ncbi:unnamed protein product, partial [marine sediment metagenome]
SIDTPFDYNGKKYILIDTAGIRHKTKVKSSADFYGSVRSKEAIERCDIAVILLDGNDGLREDDEKTVDLVLKNFKALIIAVNKWDLVKGLEMSKYEDMLVEKMKMLRNFPIIFISSKTGRNVRDSLGLAGFVYKNFTRVIPAQELAETLKMLNASVEIAAKRLKFKSLTQVQGAMPPGFIFYVNNPRLLSDNLKRYVENFMRKAHDFKGVPIAIKFNK